MQFVIEDVPYKLGTPTGALIRNYPFNDLEVDQRFFVPDGEGGKRRPIPVKAANAELSPKVFKAQDDFRDGVSGRYVYRLA